MKHIALAFFIMAAICCNTEIKKNRIVVNRVDSTITCVKVAFNISMNDYRDVTAKRFIKDSSREETVDTTEKGQIIREMRAYRDTSYWAWWGIPVPDSTGKVARKNHLGQDSVIYRFVPMSREMVIFDYNKSFK